MEPAQPTTTDNESDHSATLETTNQAFAPLGGPLQHDGYVRILAVDGGGIRGIVPAIFLQRLEQRLGIPDNGKRLCDYFDLIAGTSTGGLVALWISVPPPVKEGAMSERPRTASELVDIYLKYGGRIFPNSGTIPKETDLIARTWFGYSQSRYPSVGLNRTLQELFQNRRFADAITASPASNGRGMVVIPSYDMTRCLPRQFESWRDEHINISVADVARATSAAPTFFPPKEIFETTENNGQKSHVFTDGGIFANNPSMVALAQATYLWPEAKYVVVSVGTGYARKSFDYDVVKHWGQWEWLDPLIYTTFHAGSAITHFHLSHLAAVDKPRLVYYRRINVRLRRSLEAMDNARNIVELKNVVNDLLDKDVRYNDWLNEVVPQLTNPATATRYSFRIKDELVQLSPPKERRPVRYFFGSMTQPRHILLLQMLLIVPCATFLLLLLDNPLLRGYEALSPLECLWHILRYELLALVLVLNQLFEHKPSQLQWDLGAVGIAATTGLLLLSIAPNEYVLAVQCTLVFGLVSVVYIHFPLLLIFEERIAEKTIQQDWIRALVWLFNTASVVLMGPSIMFVYLWVMSLSQSGIKSFRLIALHTLIFWCAVTVSRAVVHVMTMRLSKSAGKDFGPDQEHLIIAPDR